MKKYLMSGVAAIAFLAAFTSCSKTTDLYEEGRKEKDQAEQKAKTTLETFNEAFVETFGTPDPNHRWGFDKPASTRTINSGWDGWISAPEDADFPADYPDGIISESEYWRYTNNERKNYYLDDKEENALNFHAGNADIWIKGTKKIRWQSPQNGMPVVTFHILPDANVTFTNDFNYQEARSYAMYIDRKATVTFKGNLSSNVYIYNRGTVIVEGTTGPYGEGAFFNEGNFTSKGNLEIYNAGSQIINANNWTVKGDLNIYGSGHFRNLAGEMTVEGNTIVNCNECSWINDATYTTENYYYTAGSHDIINNCKLFVNNDFTINNADGNCLFQVDGGGSVLTKNFYGGGKDHSGPYRVDLGSKAIFRVTNDCYLNATASGIIANKYGFCGVGNDYAVLDAKYVKNYGNPGHGYVAYGGKLYVSAESHFAQGTDNAAAGCSYIHFWDNCTRDNIYAPGFKSGKPAIKIPAEGCSIGFEGDGDGDEEQYDGRIMAEDLNATEASDFDYNDVVFDYKIDAAARKAKIKLRAAGGIYPLTVGGVEVHAKFGFTDSYPMINTGAGVTATAEAYEYEFPTGVDPSADNIPVIVTKDNIPYTLGAPTGEAAAKFCVVTTCKWMKERKFISDAYDKFDDWVRNHTVTWTTSIKDANLLYNE